MAHLRRIRDWIRKKAVAVWNSIKTHPLFYIGMLALATALATILPDIHNNQFPNPILNGIIHFIAWLAAIYLLCCFVKYLPDKQLFKSLTEKIRKFLRRLGWYELPTRWQLIFIFTATLFGLYGFYALIYTKSQELRQVWYYIFDWIFPGLNESVLEDIPCIELGLSFYAVGVLLLGQHKTAPFPEWNPYDLKVLKYSTKISPCATAYLAGLFFAAYTGTHRLAFLCTFALFFTQLSAVCFEHDLSKKAVQHKVARFAHDAIKTKINANPNSHNDENIEHISFFFRNVCEEFALVCNHAISCQSKEEKKPFRYVDIAKDIVDLAQKFVDELSSVKADELHGSEKTDDKMLNFSIGYAMLGYATQENSDIAKVRTFYQVLFSTLKNKPYMSFGLLLRISSFENNGVDTNTIKQAGEVEIKFKRETLQAFLNSGVLQINDAKKEELQNCWILESEDGDSTTALTIREALSEVFAYHRSEYSKAISFIEETNEDARTAT